MSPPRGYRPKAIVGRDEEEAHAAWAQAIKILTEVRRGYWDNPPEPAQSRLYGGSANGRTYHSPWPGIVDTCRAHGTTAVEAIACLASWWQAENLPRPLDIVAHENLSRLAERKARLRPNLIIDLGSELALFCAQLDFYLRACPDPREARRRAVGDLGLAISPLVRFAAAVAYNVPEVGDGIRPAAQAQYYSRPELYRELWSSILSPAVLAALEGR